MTPPLGIVLTAAGAPQTPTLIRHLRGNGETPVRLVGLDMDPGASGRFLCDSFHCIPAAGAEGYREVILGIIDAEKPGAFLNVSESDVGPIAALADEIEDRGTVVVGSHTEPLGVAQNKFCLYSTLRDLDPALVPEFSSPGSLDEFVETVRAMGYPERDLCFKPHQGKGTRGFRILSTRFDRRDLLFNQKPTARYMTLDEFIDIMRDEPDFPPLLLMDVVTGEECDVMTIGYRGEALLTTVKSRESHRWGVIDMGELIERPDLVEKTARIIKRIPLDYNLSLQFIGGKLIEINPRTSTFIYQDDLNEPWLAIKLALGRITPDEVRAHQAKIRFGRRMVRHMDQIFYDPDGSWSR